MSERTPGDFLWEAVHARLATLEAEVAALEQGERVCRWVETHPPAPAHAPAQTGSWSYPEGRPYRIVRLVPQEARDE